MEMHGLDIVAPMATDDGRRGTLIGNTRTLWPRFVAAWKGDPTLRAQPDPLDHYVERAVAAIVDELAGITGARAEVRFAHRPDADGRYLPFQQYAVRAGLGALAPSRLVIHPVYGPWWALRALLVFDEPAPPQVGPLPCPCTCDVRCQSALAAATAAHPDAIWPAWVALRSACQVGQAWRYSEDQIAYHGSKDLAVLERASARSADA